MHQVQSSTKEGASEVDDWHSHQRDSLRSLTFVGLVLTQFLGTTNANILPWPCIGIGQQYVRPNNLRPGLAIGSRCLVLPYLLLAAPAGYLADRFSKRNVIIGCKFAEVIMMIAAVAVIKYGHVHMMFAVVALI